MIVQFLVFYPLTRPAKDRHDPYLKMQNVVLKSWSFQRSEIELVSLILWDNKRWNSIQFLESFSQTDEK